MWPYTKLAFWTTTGLQLPLELSKLVCPPSIGIEQAANQFELKQMVSKNCRSWINQFWLLQSLKACRCSTNPFSLQQSLLKDCTSLARKFGLPRRTSIGLQQNFAVVKMGLQELHILSTGFLAVKTDLPNLYKLSTGFVVVKTGLRKH